VRPHSPETDTCEGPAGSWLRANGLGSGLEPFILILDLPSIYGGFSYSTFHWRRGRDSNPRYGFPHTHFPGVRLQPLGHPSMRCMEQREPRAIAPAAARAQAPDTRGPVARPLSLARRQTLRPGSLSPVRAPGPGRLRRASPRPYPASRSAACRRAFRTAADK
jgi:hypothetical protein